MTEPTEPKFCKDCKHFKRSWIEHLSMCDIKRDPLAGKAGVFASIERQYGTYGCGSEGGRFEARRRWKRIDWPLWTVAVGVTGFAAFLFFGFFFNHN